MGLKGDSDSNDGDNDSPVISISLGNACDFGMKLIGKKEQTLRLESGDALLFWGKNRMLLHCVCFHSQKSLIFFDFN